MAPRLTPEARLFLKTAVFPAQSLNSLARFQWTVLVDYVGNMNEGIGYDFTYSWSILL